MGYSSILHPPPGSTLPPPALTTINTLLQFYISLSLSPYLLLLLLLITLCIPNRAWRRQQIIQLPIATHIDKISCHYKATRILLIRQQDCPTITQTSKLTLLLSPKTRGATKILTT
ncbi:hypothetical protein P167DRAFT_358905 [Morchella conica CCBAS932]|uniref:Uncharacterized protein n=1 Tax=Morchella conica CCBAS932 TaxID=1392247 RepID=A0A3N4KG63_9PEZI|nr:hypothetical protein P167DRAFT_358905 [Morchella conica CCBAS932]